jgi:hypothetical protein
MREEIIEAPYCTRVCRFGSGRSAKLRFMGVVLLSCHVLYDGITNQYCAGTGLDGYNLRKLQSGFC